MKQYWVWIAIGLLLVFVVFPALVAFNLMPGMAADKIQTAAVVYSKMPAGSGLTVSLQPPPNRFSLEDGSSAQLVLTNAGAAPVTVEKLITSGCLRLTIDPKPPVLVGAHESAHRSAKLDALCGPGQFPLMLSFAWTEGAAKYEGFASTAPISVASVWGEGLPRYFRIVSALLRDFSWPVVLLLVGYLLQKRAGERDARLKDEQDVRAGRTQILNTVMPDYSKLVQAHYLAIGRRIDTVPLEAADYLEAVTRARDGSGPAACVPPPDRVLCAILLMRARMVKLLNEKGGIYFVSSVAEELFAVASKAFMEQCRKVMGKDEFGEGIELLDGDDTFTVALETCRNSRVFREKLIVPFACWVDAHAAELTAHAQLLCILSAVITFECNRPFYQIGPVEAGGGTPNYRRGNWYIDPPVVEMKVEMYNVPAGVRPRVLQLIRDWLSGIPAECKTGVPEVPAN